MTMVFVALPITRFIEDRTGWSIKRFVRTARRHRTVHIRTGHRILTRRTRYRLSSATRWLRSTDRGAN